MSLKVLTSGGGGKAANIWVNGLDEGSTVSAKTVIWQKEVANPEYVVPEGYEQLEYIESTGTQYITTDIPYNSNLSIEVVGSFSDQAASRNVLVGTNSFVFSLYMRDTGIVQFQSKTSQKNVTSSALSLSTDYTFRMNVDGLWVDGVKQSTASDTGDTPTGNMFVFKGVNDSTFGRGIIKELRFYSDSDFTTLVGNFVASKNSSGEIGMYNTVSGVFCGNSGTGEFLGGEVVPKTVKEDVVKTVQGKWETRTEYVIEPLIPTMTSDTTPSGVASAMNVLDAGRSAYMAFRNKISTEASDCTQSVNGTSLPWYLGYEFTEEREISYFEAYFSHPDKSYATSSSGYISVSNNGNDWEQVATFSGLDAGTTHEIQLEKSAKCKYFRFYFTTKNNTYVASTGASGSVRVGMIQAYGLIPVERAGHSIPIKSYGMWTVTATDGEQTTTQEVVVDAAKEYEIEVYLNRLYLYREGDECEDVTGGYVNGGASGDTSGAGFYKEADHLKLTHPTDGTQVCRTVNMVDLTEYSKIYIEVSTSTGAYNNPIIRISTGTEHGSTNVINQDFAPSATKVVYSVDISNVNGVYYVKPTLYWGAYANFYNIWLE